MIVYEIILKPVVSQSFSFVLGAENFFIRIKALGDKLYMDLQLNGAEIFQGILCTSNTDMAALYKYKGIKGSLIFLTDGAAPQYADLGSKCRLYYAI